MDASTTGVSAVPADRARWDRADFSDWVAPHLGRMRRAVRAVLPADRVDDIVQDALLRAWNRRETFDEARGTAGAWLVAIAIGQARRQLGRQQPSTLDLDDVNEVAVSDTERLPDVDLRNAIRELPTRQREVIVLFYYVDLSVDDVAHVLEIATGTVKSTLSDARRSLASTLGEE